MGPPEKTVLPQTTDYVKTKRHKEHRKEHFEAAAAEKSALQVFFGFFFVFDLQNREKRIIFIDSKYQVTQTTYI